MNICITIAMYLLMSTFLLNGYECQTLNNDTTLRKTSQFFLRNGIYKLKEMWRKIEDMGRNDNTVVGRCLGIARKLKLVMPLIVFKLGVIGTMLVFLTIFSMKSLGIGIMLLMMNVAKAFGKLAFLKFGHDKDDHEKVINYHVYKSDSQHHSTGYEDDVGYGGWHDKADISALTPSQRYKLLQLYNRIGLDYDELRRSPLNYN